MEFMESIHGIELTKYVHVELLRMTVCLAYFYSTRLTMILELLLKVCGIAH